MIHFNGVTAVIVFPDFIGSHNGFAVCKAVGQCSISLYSNGVGLLRRSAGDIKTGVAFRKAIIYRHLEVSAILIAHRGKGDGAAFRQSGLVYKIAAGDLKIGQVGDVAYIHSFGKQAVADGDGSVIILELHTLFKGSALDRGLIAGRGVYLNSFLKGAAGDGSVVVHSPLEVTIGDGLVVVHHALELEGAAGDGFVVAHILLEDATGDVCVVVHIPLEGAVEDDAGNGLVVDVGVPVLHSLLEGAAGDGTIIVGITADGTAD